MVNDMMITDEQVDECDGWLMGCRLVRVCPQIITPQNGQHLTYMSIYVLRCGLWIPQPR